MNEKQTWPGEFMTERQPVKSNDHFEGIVSQRQILRRVQTYGDGMNGGEEENETLV